MGVLEQLLWVQVARRYFLDQQTKVEIANELGISRFKVARILSACLEQGIVQISIKTPAPVDADLSESLAARFGLTHAVVVREVGEDPEQLRAVLGQAAASLLSDTVEQGDVLGVTWGRTLDAMAPALTHLAHCDVVQMTGVVGMSANSVELVKQLAFTAGGEAFPIYAPLVVSEESAARALRSQPMVAAAMSQWGRITRAAIAVGSWDPPASQLWDAVSPEERTRLRRRGVVAEVGGTLLAEDGSLVESTLPARCISMSTEQLRAIPSVVAVAGGPAKQRAVRAVLHSGLVSAVVTDETAARAALRE